jgi:small subunit ribosomal protein S17
MDKTEKTKEEVQGKTQAKVSENIPENSGEKSGKPATEKKGRIFSGVVVSSKMKDTIIVSVARYVKHPKYLKYIRRVKKYSVHDEGNTHAEGDKVKIKECRPISKTKHFKLV